MSTLRPLRHIRSIKTKISIVIIASVGVTAFMSQLGLTLGWRVWVRPVVSGAVALLMAQFLAAGMTKPLRKMVKVTKNMADGDYTERIDYNGNDEVGELATAFDKMADELAETDRLQKEFVANASHELRTPVAALRSTFENLVDGVEEVNHSTLEQMLKQTENLSTLVGQLLDLSRLDSGHEIRSQTESVDVGDLLHEVAVEIMMSDPSIPIDIRTPVGLRVEARPDHLRQVFRNIIGNASNFSYQGDAVQVVASQSWDRVRVAIRDTGPGIAPEARERIFERFWQAEGVSRMAGGGTGLGLAISKQIVETLRGQIEVSSNEPRGTCIVVDLPLTQSPSNERQPVPDKTAPAPASLR